MKKLLAFVLMLSVMMVYPNSHVSAESVPNFQELKDPALRQFVEDQVYSELSNTLDSEDYIIEKVQAIYISQEYLDEVAYNSKANIFFGYTISDLKKEFQDTAYVFTLGEDKRTVVKPFEDYDDTYNQIIRNVAIGTGVILVCVTVSVATGGLGLSTVSMVFAASAKTGTTVALSSSLLGGIAAGAIKGYETGDLNEAIKAAAYQGSESFKWGAISGAVMGGLSELRKIHHVAKTVEGATQYTPGKVEIPSDVSNWQQAELRALNEYGGFEQFTFQNGKQVAFGTKGATRPDVVRVLGDHIEAIEVKYYDLTQNNCLNTLYNELKREIKDRIIHLPKGSTQRIILDVTGRGYTDDIVWPVINKIHEILNPIYKEIPITVVGL